MKKIAMIAALIALVAAGCGSVTDPKEACRGHGGVQGIGHDATNSNVPFWCKDGTIGKVKL